MDVKRLAGATAIATGIGLSASTFGIGIVHAAPLDPPPPCPTCQPGPDGSGIPPEAPTGPNNPGIQVPGEAQIEPPVGGGPTSGGQTVQQPGSA
jgi:hypothetical protein